MRVCCYCNSSFFFLLKLLQPPKPLFAKHGKRLAHGKANCGRHGAHSLGLPAVSVPLVPSLFDPCDCMEMWLHSKGGSPVRPAGGRTTAKAAGQGISKPKKTQMRGSTFRTEAHIFPRNLFLFKFENSEAGFRRLTLSYVDCRSQNF